MQHPWRCSVRDILDHLLKNSAVLVMFSSVTVFDSVLIEIAGRLVISKFVFHILVALEYALVVGDATMIVMFLILSIWNKLRRI